MGLLRRISLVLAVSYAVYWAWCGQLVREAKGSLVVITGCNGGLGQAAAARLKRSGFDVIATVRREKDKEALLKAVAGLHVVVGDMTTAEGVEAVVAAVGARPLAAIVHNAALTSGFCCSGVNTPLFIAIPRARPRRTG